MLIFPRAHQSPWENRRGEEEEEGGGGAGFEEGEAAKMEMRRGQDGDAARPAATSRRGQQNHLSPGCPATDGRAGNKTRTGMPRAHPTFVGPFSLLGPLQNKQRNPLDLIQKQLDAPV